MIVTVTKVCHCENLQILKFKMEFSRIELNECYIVTGSLGHAALYIEGGPISWVIEFQECQNPGMNEFILELGGPTPVRRTGDGVVDSSMKSH